MPIIVLDTNVVSELMEVEPNRTVLDWYLSRPAEDLFVTAITEAELWFGVDIMVEGRRRNQIAAEIRGMLDDDFVGRILPFDSAAARAHASMSAQRRRTGAIVPIFDAQIAAIAMSRQAPVATRDVRHFHGVGVEIINPWNPS